MEIRNTNPRTHTPALICFVVVSFFVPSYASLFNQINIVPMFKLTFVVAIKGAHLKDRIELPKLKNNSNIQEQVLL